MRAFATSVRERLGDTPVDALVLNAGVVRPDVTGRTVDGFETTFAVNHLAHYLLLRLLLPALADGAIVVLTTSGTHDPATGAGLAPPRHADAELLAHPDRDPDRDARPRKAGEHAYTASKLCAVLTARSLSEHPDIQTRRLTVVAYDPGQVFGTGLAKDLSFPLRISLVAAGHTGAGVAAAPTQPQPQQPHGRWQRLGRPGPRPRDAPERTHLRRAATRHGSPGRTRRNWHAETNWRRHSGTTAPGSSACRTDADHLTSRRTGRVPQQSRSRGMPECHGEHSNGTRTNGTPRV